MSRIVIRNRKRFNEKEISHKKKKKEKRKRKGNERLPKH
jgi:hypothetical protein